MAAIDGQTLSGQSAQTQSDFQSVYGSNAASAWEAEHNAAIAPAATAPAQSTTPTVSANTNNTNTGAATPTTSGSDATDALKTFFSQTSGVTQAQLAQQKAEFDAQMAFQEKQMQQLGIPQLQINQYLANLQQQQFQAQVAQTQAQLTGYYTPPQFSTLSLSNPTASGVTQQAGTGTNTGNIALDAFNTKAGAHDQQTYLQATGGDRNAAANRYWADVQGAISSAGMTPQQFVYGAAGAPTGGAGQPAGSQQTLALGQLLGTFNGQQTEAAREFAQQQALAAQNQAFQQALAAANLNLQQGQLGQQYLSTAASLQGPQNTFQLSNYLRGAQANPQVPTYLSALASNLGLPSFQATGSTAPTPASAGGLGGQLSNTSSATPGWDYGSTIDTINRIQAQGAKSLAPGTLEQLTPDELQAFGSGLGAIGGSLPSFMQSYQQSRVGQNAPVAQTRLA